MSEPVGSQQKRRGRPRSEKARTAILDAATELLLEQGLEAVSMDEVAERAGVSKATIYRWWPSKETLALDALYHEWDTAPPEPPDTGSLRGDLLALLRPWIRRVRARPYGRVVAELVAEAQTDPEFASIYHARFVAPRREPGRALLRRAIERGELPPDTTSISHSTSSTARSTTGSCTATHPSTTASSGTSSTPCSPASASSRRREQAWRAPVVGASSLENRDNGGYRDRTGDLYAASVALSQLS